MDGQSAQPHDALAEAAQQFSAVANDATLRATLDRVAQRTATVLGAGGRLLLCGNGGSAAEATHLASELIGAFQDRRRAALAAIPLGFDPGSLTAVANDFGYPRVFARQLQGLGRTGDMLWALSTSGNSLNIIEALRQARAMGITTVLFANHHGGQARALADEALLTPQAPPPRVQELHLLFGHYLCEQIETQLA